MILGGSRDMRQEINLLDQYPKSKRPIDDRALERIERDVNVFKSRQVNLPTAELWASP